MKISESNLRKMVREVITELTTSVRTTTRTKLKPGERSAAYKSAEADVKKADTDVRSAESTERTAQTNYDRAKTITKTKQQARIDAFDDLERHRRTEPKALDARDATYQAVNGREHNRSAVFMTTTRGEPTMVLVQIFEDHQDIVLGPQIQHTELGDKRTI